MSTMKCSEIGEVVKERDVNQGQASRACKTDVFFGDHTGMIPAQPATPAARHAQNSNENQNALTNYEVENEMMSVVGVMENNSSLPSETALDVNGDVISTYSSVSPSGIGDENGMGDEVRLLRKERDDALDRANFYQQQLDILFQGMGLISRLSSLDSGSYSRTIATADDASWKMSCSSAPSSIQAQLDQLQQEWKLEQTPIPALISSIHRLQSNILLLQSQADNYNTNDDASQRTITSLQEKLAASTEENKKLKKAAKKLLHDNKRMKNKLSERKAERKSLVKSVKEYVKKKREEDLDKEEFFVATKLTVHESMLKIARNENGSHGNRQRSWTGESMSSTFSDLGRYLDRDDSSQYIHSDSNNTLDAGDDESNDAHNIFSVRKTCTEDCNVSLSDSPASSSSLTSLVTDDSSPTVRFSIPESDVPLPYVLTFPQDKIGLQFVQVKVPSMPLTDGGEGRQGAEFHGLKPRNMALGTSNGNRCGASSDGCALDLSAVEEGLEKNLSGTKNRRSLMKTSGKNLPSERKQSKSHHGFKIDNIFKLHGSFSSDKNVGCSPDEKQNAFLVQDFQGFDTSLNVRPTIGARLIAINDISLLTGEWTMKKVMEHLKKTKIDDYVGLSGKISLTFRNDPLDKDQKNLLNLSATSDKRLEGPQKNNVGKSSPPTLLPLSASASAATATIASMPKTKKSPHFFPSSFLGMKIAKKVDIGECSPTKETENECNQEKDIPCSSTKIVQNAKSTKKVVPNDPISDALGINFIKFY